MSKNAPGPCEPGRDSATSHRAMQRGTVFLFLGIFSILAGVLALKLTDRNVFWALIALGAAIGSHGGISISQRARG